MNNFAAFNIRLLDAVALLPEHQKKDFMVRLIGALSVHVEDRTAMRCMEHALDSAQGFEMPEMKLVRK